MRPYKEMTSFVCVFSTDSSKCVVTWEMVMRDTSIRSIQEPISQLFIDKTDFNSAYLVFLDSLDGSDMSSFVDFFWQKSALDRTCLEFIDEDSRLDIYDYLLEHDLIPEMDKVHSGDWKFSKLTAVTVKDR